MGLLDYLNNGFDNSVGHLNNLKDSFANQPKMYDPHANAQALMGGQAMQYNQQPQSLIGGNNTQVNSPATEPQGPNMPVANPTYTQQSPWTEAVVNAPQSPWGSQQQQGLLNLGDGASNVNLGQTSETWGSGYDGTPTEGYTPIDTTGSPDYGVNSNRPVYDTPTDETDYAATSKPYRAPSDIIGEAFDPSMTEEERLLREAAKANLPWYLGGTGGK